VTVGVASVTRRVRAVSGVTDEGTSPVRAARSGGHRWQ
jgi:hypothetical protein